MDLRSARAEADSGVPPVPRPPSRDAADPGTAPTARLLRSLGEVADHLVGGTAVADVVAAIEYVLLDAIPDVFCSVVPPAAPAPQTTGAWTRPLTAADGVTVGHLVVRPAVPRDPTDDERALLDLVARLALVGVDHGRQERWLRDTAGRDRMSGLPNRVQLLEHAARLHLTGRTPTILVSDIDRFRMINMGLGHHVGDEVLRTVAGRLRDAVTPDAVVARFGGDEFAALLPDLGARDIAALAEHLARAVSEPMEVNGRDLHVTMCVGVALPGGGADPVGLLRRADVALQEAKRRGHGQIVVREPRADEPDARALFELEQAIRHATADGQLRTYYQPIARCSDDRVICYETLVRWQHPDRGLLLPDAFLGVARDAGLIGEIDRWVVRTAAAEVAEWPVAADGLAPSVAVNLDGRASVSASATKRLLALVDESGLPPHRLVVEITEHVFSADQREVVRTLSQLRSHGIRVAIDDFGTGWSSLHRLRTVPLDMLKVDRSFIADLGRRAEAAALLDAIVTMGHALGLEIIAEGVETAEQLQEVRRLGCDMAQGFLLGSPAPGCEVSGAHLARAVADG